MIRVNLAPPRRRHRERLSWPAFTFNAGLLLAVLGGLVALAFAVSAGWLLREERRLVAEAQVAEREISALKTMVGPAAKMKDHLADLQARLTVVQTLTKGQERPLLLVDAFADAVPPDMWITGLEEKETVLRVTGAAFSTMAVSNLMSALRASGKFRDVDIVVSKHDLAKTPNLVTFEVTCRFHT